MKKTKVKKIAIIVIAIILTFTLSAFIYAGTVEKTTIVCEDANLYKVLKNSLNKYIIIGSSDDSAKSFSIPTSDIESITKLSLVGSGSTKITNLSGLENFTSLQELDLSENNIKDITPILNIKGITKLNLSGNKVGNISSLVNEPELIELQLSGTGLSSIDFMSKLSKIQVLNVSNNTISNLQSINNMSSLKTLNVSNNKNLTSMSDIFKRTSITELNISSTGITDLTGIEVMSRLESLDASNLTPKNSSSLASIVLTQKVGKDTVPYLSNLQKLNLNNTKGLQISKVKVLKTLTELYMENNDISNIAGITDLENLVYLDLANNKISNIDSFIVTTTVNGEEVIKRLTAKQINLSNNNISNVSIFAGLSSIENLNLDQNRISDSSALEGLNYKTNGLSLRGQDVTIAIYQKTKKSTSDVIDDQYIILPEMLQASMRQGSKIYSNNNRFETYGVTLNSSSEYQEPGNYNIIIDKEKTSKDELSVTLRGGVADGSIMRYKITSSSTSIDSLKFDDINLNEAIYKSLYEQMVSQKKNIYLKRVPKIINITQSEIANTKELQLSDAEITNLRGLANFYNLNILNLSGNKITDITELEPCVNMTELNISNTQVHNNYASITKMPKLVKLDLANSGMTSIENINRYVSELINAKKKIALTQLNISNNKVENINGLERITTLTQLHMAGTKTNDLTPIQGLTNLTTLNISGNDIIEISKLSGLNNLRYLDLSSNKIQDLSAISDKSLTELNISGNRIKDLTYIANMSNLIKLKADNNLIDNITPIQYNLIKDEFSIRNQKVVKVLADDAKGQLIYELPQIFKTSMDQESKVYTADELELVNCTLSSEKDSVIIDADKLGNNIATVTIRGGTADGTRLSIAPTLKGDIEYSTKNKTNQDVTAKIKFNRSDVTIINNEGKDTYTFTENGAFTFEYLDDYGFEGSTEAYVDWIDKTAPNCTVEKELISGGKIQVTIKSDEKIKPLEGWTLSEDGLTLTKEYANSANELLRISDEVGNITNVDLEVIVDKTPPTITGVKDGEKYQQAVTAIIEDENLASVILTKDGQEVPNYKSGDLIKEKGKYILIAKDTYENETRITFEIEQLLDIVTSNTYKVDEDNLIISKIRPETVVNDLQKNIDNEMTYEIKDLNGNKISNTARIGTGYKLQMEDGKQYTLVVYGDLNGDTRANVLDIAKLQKIIVGATKQADVTDLVKLASDLKEDGKINILDLAKLQRLATGQNIF